MAHNLWLSAWYKCMRRITFEHGLSKISFELSNIAIIDLFILSTWPLHWG